MRAMPSLFGGCWLVNLSELFGCNYFNTLQMLKIFCGEIDRQTQRRSAR